MGSLIGGLFGEKEKPSTQQSGLGELFRYFPQLRELGNQAIQRGQDLYGDASLFTPAPLVGLEQRGLDLLRNFQMPGNVGKFDFGKKADAAYGLASKLFSGVNPLVNQAGDYFAQGAKALGGDEIRSSISDFFNPYNEQVIGGIERDALRDRERQLGLAGGLAANNNAFGGTRQAVLEGDILRSSGENLLDTTGRFRQQGYESAADRGLMRLLEDRGRSLTAGSGTISGANALTAAGSGATNLGSSLFSARMGMYDRNRSNRNDALSNAINLSNAKLAGGGLVRGINQQTQQVPLQQFEFLKSLFNMFPASSSGTGGTAGTTGLFGSSGTPNFSSGTFFNPFGRPAF